MSAVPVVRNRSLKHLLSLFTLGFISLTCFWMPDLDGLVSTLYHILCHQNLGDIAVLKRSRHCCSWEFSKLLTPVLQSLMLCASYDTRGRTAFWQPGGAFRHGEMWENVYPRIGKISSHAAPDPEIDAIGMPSWGSCVAFQWCTCLPLLHWLVTPHICRLDDLNQRDSLDHSIYLHSP